MCKKLLVLVLLLICVDSTISWYQSAFQLGAKIVPRLGLVKKVSVTLFNDLVANLRYLEDTSTSLINVISSNKKIIAETLAKQSGFFWVRTVDPQTLIEVTMKQADLRAQLSAVFSDSSIVDKLMKASTEIQSAKDTLLKIIPDESELVTKLVNSADDTTTGLLDVLKNALHTSTVQKLLSIKAVSVGILLAQWYVSDLFARTNASLAFDHTQDMLILDTQTIIALSACKDKHIKICSEQTAIVNDQFKKIGTRLTELENNSVFAQRINYVVLALSVLNLGFSFYNLYTIYLTASWSVKAIYASLFVLSGYNVYSEISAIYQVDKLIKLIEAQKQIVILKEKLFLEQLEEIVLH